MKYLIAISIVISMSLPVLAQEAKHSLEKLIELALERNPAVQEAGLETKKHVAFKRTAFEIPKTDVTLLYGQYNSIQKSDNNITIVQGIPFPTFLARQNALNKMNVTAAELKESMTKNEITFQVKQVFNHLLYLKARALTLLQQDSLLTRLSNVTALQFKSGESTLLAKTSAETHLLEMKNQLARNKADIQTAVKHLQLLCQNPDIKEVSGNLENIVQEVEIDSAFLDQNPASMWTKHQVEIARQQKKVESARVLPDLRVGYFNQTLIGNQNVNGQEVYFNSDKRFQGFQVGLAIPLWFAPHVSRVQAAHLGSQVAEKQQEAYHLSMTQQYSQATQELKKNKTSVEYFRTSALATAKLLTTQSQKSFESGELDYSTLLLHLRQALSIQEEYLMALYQYNNSIITLYYLNGNK